MSDTIITFAALTICTVMVCYLAFAGRLTSRAVFVLMPAATLVIAALTLLAEADNPLLPFVAVAMAIAAVFLMGTAIVMLVILFTHVLRSRPKLGDASNQEPSDSKAKL